MIGVILIFRAGNSVHPCPLGRSFRYIIMVTSLKEFIEKFINYGIIYNIMMIKIFMKLYCIVVMINIKADPNNKDNWQVRINWVEIKTEEGFYLRTNDG